MRLSEEITERLTISDSDYSLLLLSIVQPSLVPRPLVLLFSSPSRRLAVHISSPILDWLGAHLFSIGNRILLVLEVSWNGGLLRTRSDSVMSGGGSSRTDAEDRLDNSSLRNKYKRPNKMK